MSRIIVKNLPLKITEEDLKRHFSQAGTVTDAKLKFKNGESRRFAFIGFKNSEEASSACHQFKDTYLNENKIFVEICKHLDTEEIKKKLSSKTFDQNIPSKEKNEVQNTDTKETGEIKKKYNILYTVVIRTREQNANKDKHGKTFTKKGVKTFLKPLKYLSLRIPRKISYVAYVGFKSEKEMKQAMLKDKSFLEGVRVRVHKYNDHKSDSVADERSGDRWAAAQEKLSKAEPIEESGKLFVRNLWYSTTQKDLEELFGEIGPLADVTIPLCKITRKIKGFAHISYILPEHAAKALQELDGKDFQGRPLHILPSLLKDENDSEDQNFKDKRNNKIKENSSWKNWNSLFLGPTAVIDLVAEGLEKTKHDILTSEGNSNVAVTLALGEAKIVAETKSFLEAEGVCLESFAKPDVQRSSTVLLVKHLPAHTTAQEIKQIFEKYGQLGRLVLPPSGLTAVVEFLDSSEAKLAYSNLAYTRFKHLPLYLEWAPIKAFNTSVQRNDKNSARTDSSTTNITDVKLTPSSSSTTLFIKNLNFTTDEDALNEHFSKVGEVYTVRIAKKRCLSQGYGFVQYIKQSSAKKALTTLQDSLLDGHNLIIKVSDKTFVPESATKYHRLAVNQDAPTIMVKNIPFDSPLTEIRDIFKVFGEISAIRLPRHLDIQQHRGFCFIKFLYKDSAEKAFETISLSTHLRGRRLVLEWAKDDETINDIRKRTADHFLSSDTAKRRQKVVMAEEHEIEDE